MVVCLFVCASVSVCFCVRVRVCVCVCVELRCVSPVFHYLRVSRLWYGAGASPESRAVPEWLRSTLNRQLGGDYDS